MASEEGYNNIQDYFSLIHCFTRHFMFQENWEFSHHFLFNTQSQYPSVLCFFAGVVRNVNAGLVSWVILAPRSVSRTAASVCIRWRRRCPCVVTWPPWSARKTPTPGSARSAAKRSYPVDTSAVGVAGIVARTKATVSSAQRRCVLQSLPSFRCS